MSAGVIHRHPVHISNIAEQQSSSVRAAGLARWGRATVAQQHLLSHVVPCSVWENSLFGVHAIDSVFQTVSLCVCATAE